MRDRSMPTEARCSLEEQAIRDEINAFLKITGTSLKNYMPATQEKMVEHWSATRPTDAMREALEVPKVWSQEDCDRLECAYVNADMKHGFYETMFAVAAEGIRIANERAALNREA